MNDWQPTAAPSMLARRAAMLAQVRAFFTAAGVLEVDVPVLGEAGVTDLHIDNIEARVEGRTGYLQSSPEYYMKRLLAAGSGAIYYLGKAFRDGERGRRHNPEFTLLEWYRPGWDEGRLMTEVAALFSHLGVTGNPRYISYRQVFEDALGLDPHRAGLPDLWRWAADLAGGDWSGETRSDCLDLLFSHAVEPTLPPGTAFVTDYPACQCALARLGNDDRGNTVARRFEVFVDGVELGNGYYELTDAAIQQRRFEQDLALRRQYRRRERSRDSRLLAALEAGLPDCAGVAIGFDRLLMQLARVDHIRRVIPFDR